MRNIRLLGLVVALAAWPAVAQVDTGTITGAVRDSQGAGVGSATVTFVDVATGTVARTQSDATGEYVSPPLRPSDYKVTAEAAGFKTESHTGITLRVQDRLRIDFAMSVGAVSETV